MRSKLALVATMAALATSNSAFAQSGQDHAAHHPAASAAASKGTKSRKPKAPVAASAPTSAQMGVQMQAMREMHEKMMAAKTPEQREALMAEHMKAMQDGMALMGQMQSGAAGDAGMPMNREMMGKRMDMMQMMMQMMMDRDAVAAPAPK